MFLLISLLSFIIQVVERAMTFEFQSKTMRIHTDCKTTGPGYDYVGHLNVTRSKRPCKRWSDVDNSSFSYFFDPSLKTAENYCRNPDKAVSLGCWCYTDDPRVRRDLCFVPDCDRPLGCTLLTTKYINGSFIYIMPSWRRKTGLEFWLKTWNPDIYDGLVLSLVSMNKTERYILTIGDDDNEYVRLAYSDGGTAVVVEEKILPHLVSSGKWAGFWLHAGDKRIALGRHGVPTPMFEWTTPGNKSFFQPIYMGFGTAKDTWIGISFKCSECLVQETSVSEENKLYPINLWKEDEDVSKLRLNLRGTGSAIITLMWTLDFHKNLAIEIDAFKRNLSLVRYKNPKEYKTMAAYIVNNAILDEEWSVYHISFTDDNLKIYKNNEPLVHWKSPYPLVFYWFSVSARGGIIKWSANCPTPDIDGKPRDGSWGDWGPWTCSVTCGRGEGRVERKCDHPPPNIFGKMCKGSAVYEGSCNDFPCGDVTPDTYALIRRQLESDHSSLEVEAKEKVELVCNPLALKLLRKEVNFLNVSWSHNGVLCSKTKFHILDNYTLVIPRAQEKHNGVYLCSLHQKPESIPEKVHLTVISLVVKKNKPTKKVRKGNSMVLKCNSLALSFVYADLSQRWELNGTPWREYGMGVVEMLTTDKLDSVDDSHAGIWTCVVTQEDFNFKWTTNWINLKVKTAPNLWSHIMEDLEAAQVFKIAGNERNTLIIFFSLITVLIWIIILLIFCLVKVSRKC